MSTSIRVRSIEVTVLCAADEPESHPLATRSYWEVTESICESVATAKLKSSILVVICVMFVYIAHTRCYESTNEYWGFVGGEPVKDYLPSLIICSSICECIISVAFRVKSLLHTLIWLLLLMFVNLACLFILSETLLTVSFKLLFIHILMTTAIYHVYRWVLFKNYFWTTPDCRHLCSMWVPTPKNKNHMLVSKVKQDGKTVICGTVGIVHVTDEVAMLARMSVLPSLRGLGIAKRLLYESLEDCRENGYKQVILSTSNYQPVAESMYKKAGFCKFSSYSINFHIVLTWFYLNLETEARGLDEADLVMKLKKISQRCTHQGVTPEEAE